MKRILLAILISCAWSLAPAMQSQPPPQSMEPNVYGNPAEEARFHALTTTLRCVMCQNQSLADSDAPIAHDLRREILDLMRQGKSDAQIRDYLVARYGEFVLYKPRVEPATWTLWFGPLVLFVAGAATVAWNVRRRARMMRQQPSRPAAGDDKPAVESSEEW